MRNGFHRGSTFDFREVGNVGQSVSLVRIGESFLAQVGINVDSGRDNASVFFNLEPRFFPFRGLGNLGGQNIPPQAATVSSNEAVSVPPILVSEGTQFSTNCRKV